MFTHFYNTFRPVNRTHYTKYGVNSSLLTHFWLLQKVCGTLDHCFITTHIFHNEGDLQIYFGVIFLETRHHAQAHITSGAFIHCALSLATRRIWMAAEFGWWFRWPVLVMVTLELQNIFCTRTWSSNQFGVGWLWLFPASSIKFLTRRSLKSWWVYSAPHEDNSIHLLSTVRSRKWKIISWSTWRYVDSSNSC